MIEEFLRAPDDSLYRSFNPSELGSQVIPPRYVPDQLEQVQAAIIGIREDRASKRNAGSAAAPDDIRAQLFGLSRLHKPLTIADLGNIEAGSTLRDTYVAISQVCNELLRRRVVCVLLGGSHDLTFGQYLAYQELRQPINLAVIDSSIDFFDGEENINDENFLGRVFVVEPSCLASAAVLGYQTHLTAPRSLEILDKLHYEYYRLGKIRTDISDIEPVLRGASLVSFDMSAIRFGDAPAHVLASPNGLFGEEACQLAFYAGQGNASNTFGLYGCNLAYDRNDQSVKLAAQIIWYFLEGLSMRHDDLPADNQEDYVRYTVCFKQTGHELHFWKNRKSDRWWMEVPRQGPQRNQRKVQFIPCSYNDYKTAVREELPERWIRAQTRANG